MSNGSGTVTQDDVNNTQQMVSLLDSIVQRLERVSESFSTEMRSAADYMVNATMQVANNRERERDALSESSSMQQEAQEALEESNSFLDSQSRYYEAMVQSVANLNQGLTESTFHYTQNNKLTQKSKSLAEGLYELHESMSGRTSERAMEGARSAFAAYEQLVAIQGNGITGLQKMGLAFETAGEVASNVLDAITAHPVVRVVVIIAKILFKIYDLGKKVIQTLMFIANAAAEVTKKLLKLMIGIPLKISEFAAQIGGTFRKETVEQFDQMKQDLKDSLTGGSALFEGFSNSVDEGKKNLLDFYEIGGKYTKYFGYGSAGLNKVLKDSQDIIMQLGVNIDFFGRKLGSTLETRANLVKLQKSLAASAEDMENLAIYARSTGQGFMSLGVRIKTTIDSASKKFGIDSKIIGKDVLRLRGDFINFGHMTDEALAQTVGELKQLGVQAEDVAGIFKKFDTFESAVQSAAMLSQTFGMNVDALRLIQAEKPEEIFKELTNAMYNTGRSFDDLNRHEKELLAQHTGMSAKTLKMVMNYTEMGDSFEEAMSKAEAQDPVNKQTAALDKMTESIKELNKTLSFKSPITAFADGLKKTLLQNQHLRNSVESLSAEYESFYTAGLKLSESDIEKVTKPFREIVDQIGKIFKEGDLKGVMTKLFKGISGFVSNIMEKDGIPAARKSFREMFSFDSLSKGGTMIQELLKTGGHIIGYVVKGVTIAIDEISLMIIKAIKGAEIEGGSTIQELIKDYFGLDGSFLTTFNKMLVNLGNAFTDSKVLVGPLMAKMKNVFSDIAGFFVDTLSTLLKPVLLDLLGNLKSSLSFGLAGGGDISEAAALRENARLKSKLTETSKNPGDTRAILKRIDQIEKKGEDASSSGAVGFLGGAAAGATAGAIAGSFVPVIGNIVGGVLGGLAGGIGGYFADRSSGAEEENKMLKELARKRKLDTREIDILKSNDVLVQTDNNDIHTWSKQGEFLEKAGLMGKSVSPYKTIEKSTNEFVNVSKAQANQMRKEISELSKKQDEKIEKLINAINNKENKVVMNLDGKAIGEATFREMTSTKNMGNRLREESIFSPSQSSTVTYT